MPDGCARCIAGAPPETVRYNRSNMHEMRYATIAVDGADSLKFLQGQLTIDLSKLDGPAPALGAWCNPKGRVITLLRTRTDNGTFRLALPEPLAEPVVNRLTMFRFRAKVGFMIVPLAAADLGLDSALDDGLDGWRRSNLERGIPEIGPEQTEKFTPHMLNLDLLGAVSFDKGCYTGQEVVARTHYRGASRRRLLRFEATSPVEPGTKVAHAGRDIGEVLNAIGTDLLAVVPVDSPASGLSAGGVGLRKIALPYLA